MKRQDAQKLLSSLEQCSLLLEDAALCNPDVELSRATNSNVKDLSLRLSFVVRELEMLREDISSSIDVSAGGETSLSEPLALPAPAAPNP